MSSAKLISADLRGVILRGADLNEADLQNAKLTGADLRGANLRHANLRRTTLHWAYLRRANLRGADLTGAKLCDADLTGADLTGAVGITEFPTGDPRGFRLVAVLQMDGTKQLIAGCRCFTTADAARKHWGEDYGGERAIGDLYLATLNCWNQWRL
jgi:uncharacterized protein YjbI with pentapeptide repeats